MTFDLKLDWLSAGNDAPEYRDTMAMLELSVGGTKLTQHEDLFSKTIRDSVLVSAYPLALWFASSWWRLHCEPLPARETYPCIDWRMAHELGAANHGFVWPQVMFASDGQNTQVWALPSEASLQQSVRYLNGLNEPVSIPLNDFQRSSANFIDSVISRLSALDMPDTDLAKLWAEVKKERSDPESEKYRKIEASMGFDPDECPEDIMYKALQLEESMGDSAFAELAPVYGKTANGAALAEIEKMKASPGLRGCPKSEIRQNRSKGPSHLPWQRAVEDARMLRKTMGYASKPIENAELYALLGINFNDHEQSSLATRSRASIAIPDEEHRFIKFLPRKTRLESKRFELARFLADYQLWGTGGWLASTELGTFRQKYQRAFAAEFLCPIEGLREYLQDDFSESAQEDAAEKFSVSHKTINSLLTNNHLIPSAYAKHNEASFPYASSF